jgi:hypothetical protein
VNIVTATNYASLSSLLGEDVLSFTCPFAYNEIYVAIHNLVKFHGPLIILNRLLLIGSWSSSVSIVSDYRLDDRGSICGRGRIIFHLASVSRPALGPTPPIQWVQLVLSRGKARPELECDHSPPSSAKVENE